MPDVAELKALLEKPYWFEEGTLPGMDFNRELIAPGASEHFPDGAVGIRVDDDFWAVAAIPFRYKDISLPNIVAALWPEYLDRASYAPDSGSVEQRIYTAERMRASDREMISYLNKQNSLLRSEITRIQIGRRELWAERCQTRYRAETDYFVRQYEHLLVAMAHEAIPRPDAQGVCSSCGLFCSDRVHARKYRDLNAKGFAPSMQWIGELPRDDEWFTTLIAQQTSSTAVSEQGEKVG